MNCKTAQARLTALRDGELSPSMAARVREHLETCEDCAQALAEIEAILRQADAWQVSGEGDLWAAIQQEIETTDLRDVLAEMAKLRAEVRALRTEIAELRAHQSPAAPDRKPAVLLPSVTKQETLLRFM